MGKKYGVPEGAPSESPGTKCGGRQGPEQILCFDFYYKFMLDFGIPFFLGSPLPLFPVLFFSVFLTCLLTNQGDEVFPEFGFDPIVFS